MIHVAGTNGKGSTIAMLRGIYEAAGLKVHADTSPHLVRYNERFYVAGEEIGDAALVAILEDCERVNGGVPITLFEITTAAAFLAFSRSPADVLLLEVGLGGRFDATNVVEKPAVSVITPVSMDHMGFLGDTIEKIAFEKAGILKPGVPAVIGPQDPAALAVIAARAAEVGAPLYRYGQEWNVAEGGDGILFSAGGTTRRYPKPGLLGAHQIANAGQALMAADLAEKPVPSPEGARAKGIAEASWPARMQQLQDGALTEYLAPGSMLWVDGGHNESAGAAVAAILDGWAAEPGALPVHLLFGSLNTRDPAAYLRHLKGRAKRLYVMPIPGEENSLSEDELMDGAKRAAMPAVPVKTVQQALRDSQKKSTPVRFLICGSLYLAGHALGISSGG
ncbi:bifunctional folylpolyglutamate synthase/dihydrofolate synthase [Nisaea acidiphila]|uniref:tetrahydrofolate synthase n=1 Tax=Nisaea acidiphila TaxID=1862145 RepID=A0A9J7B279_9PROT|nr:folylpolyglutamate synthase/dihydrofolate synthase family protein [Nisaea acidiphila]UUX51773.1 bifunctional folylpolyglutamate synthase/dihydrofolate synthase [Nisaea acidiphila]